MHTRQAHYLRKTKGNKHPTQVVALGVCLDDFVMESKGEHTGKWMERRQCLGVAAERWRMEGGKETRFSEIGYSNYANFWQWLYTFLRPGSCTWVFTCNAFESLTCLGIWHEVEKGILVLHNEKHSLPIKPNNGGPTKAKGYLVAEDPPTIICLTTCGGSATVKFLDIRNYGVESWNDLSGWVDSNGRISQPEPDKETPVYQAAWRAAAVASWYRSWTSLLDGNKLGAMQHTAASQAFYSFRHSFLSKDHVLIHDRKDVLALERAALYGGRCEARKIGELREVISHYDVTSMYGGIARDEMLPIRLMGSVTTNGERSWNPASDAMYCVACVMIDTPLPIYPYRLKCTRCDDAARGARLPYGGKNCGLCKTVWPVGRFTTTLAGPELYHAVVNGHVKATLAYAQYMISPFLKEWANSMYELRQEYGTHGLPGIAKMVKAIGNALYGKFGQRSNRWVHDAKINSDYPYEAWHEYNPTDDSLTQYRSVAWHVEKRESTGEAAHSFPAITAFMHSYGRMRLWEYMQFAGLENVYYHDTDSLWVSQNGAYRLNRSIARIHPGMGSLREVEYVQNLRINGIKHYVKDGKRVCAGIPPGGRVTSYVHATVKKTDSVMMACAGSHPPRNNIHDEIKVYRDKYTHGTVNDDGTVIPLVVMEW